jgi:hypothetical protein
MPAIGFLCPDKAPVMFQDCLKECRLKDDLPMGRCKALPFLRKCTRQREWTGEPSTTQLITGTREAWLKITMPYFINPDDKVYSLLGTNVHSILDKFGQGDHLTEERLRDEICSGQFDFYDGEQQILYDYKTWGSYKVQQALGIRCIEEPETDESGQPLLKTRGKNKGLPKTKKVWLNGDIATKAVSLLDTSIQMSNYRDKLLSVLPTGYTVKKMAVQAISRDSGLMVSIMRGIEENAPLIPINGVSKHWVDKFLNRKRDLLFTALKDDYAPLCKKRQRWFGKKCKSYCEVSEQCHEKGGWETDPIMRSLIIEEEADKLIKSHLAPSVTPSK